MKENIEDLLYDFLKDEEHPWRTWAKKERTGKQYPLPMSHYFVEWRKKEQKSSFNIDENDIEDAKFKEIKKKNK